MPPAFISQTIVVQNDKAQLQIEVGAVVAKLAGTEQAFAAAKKCLNADEKTITALEGQAASLKDWLSFYRQQLGITSEEAKVCMTPCNSSSSVS